MIFTNIKTRSGAVRRINLIADKFPMVLNDGFEDIYTNTVEFIRDNRGDAEVIAAVKTMLKTQEPQLVGMGFTIRLR